MPIKSDMRLAAAETEWFSHFPLSSASLSISYRASWKAAIGRLSGIVIAALEPRMIDDGEGKAERRQHKAP